MKDINKREPKTMFELKRNIKGYPSSERPPELIGDMKYPFLLSEDKWKNNKMLHQY